METNLEADVNLTDARGARSLWKEHVRASNKFSGKSKWEKAQLGSCSLFRLTVLPDGWKNVPPSFAVQTELSWSRAPEQEAPLAIEWLQANESRFDFYFKLPSNFRCLGLGERFSGLNVRGQKHTLITTDNPQHEETMDAMYQSIPFLLIGREQSYKAVFVDSPAVCRFDLDTELVEQGRIEVFTRRPFRIYFFDEAPLPELVSSFTELVGRSDLPPLWSLGHQQCRWSYPDEMTVRELANEFRQRKIPCDTIVLDIDYMDEYRVFSTSKERFPTFDKMVSDLVRDHFKLITIIDPGVKQEPGYGVFDQGVNKGLFCEKTDGELFVEKVWPGDSVFPDFLQKETRQWWGAQHSFLTDKGIAGIWNDMNEPAFFGTKKLLEDNFEQLPPADHQLCMHQSEDGPVPHFEVRNLYGFLMSEATHGGLLAARPNERPFILTRSGATGIQRYAAVWLGDNKSWYDHLAHSIPMLLNMGISGVPFVGVDIGGFWGDAPPELLLRWYALGMFYPLFRNHCALGFRGQEPFAYAPGVELLVRKLIEARYRLLPYIRNLFWEHSRTGAPLMRPLAWHYPHDDVACDIDDQFLLGADILVTPIVKQGQEFRTVYFPAGRWYDIETHDVFDGPGSSIVRIPLGKVPAWVREGAIIPMKETMQHTGEYEQSKLTFHAFGNQARTRHFEDDGISFDYRKGQYNELDVSFANGKLTVVPVHKGYEDIGKYEYVAFGGP